MGAAASQAKEPILKERLDTRWVITQHPTPADAQQAEMSTAGWREYVYDAMLRDWSGQRERQERVADVLEEGETVRIVAGDRTDLELSIEGMHAYNDDATENLPGGEVATSPVVDSATGRVTVDYPTRRRGQVIDGIWLEFDDGEVVDYGAERNEEVLATLLDTDEGARRLGELGIGMNRGIDEISHNILFDEKMGGTVHVALGHAMAECVPEDRAFNGSSLHMDLLLDTSEDARIAVDGDDIQRDGEFWFEK
jgi:aminopeptidase